MNGVDWRTKIEQAEGRAIREKREMRERLAAAEQRANDAEARAERLAAACKIGLGVIVRSDLKGKEPREAIAALTDALTTPATQPDERAAAIKAALDRLAKRILAEIVYCAPENRALAEEVARVAKIETDLIVARHDATDSAAKEE